MDHYTIYTWTDALAPHMCWTGFTPNMISVTHGVLVTGVGMWNFVHYRSTIEFALILALRCLLDGLDGSVARACHNGSPIGDAFDSALDCFPAMAIAYFVWTRVQLSFWQKLLLPTFFTIAGYFAAQCNHSPDTNTFCYYYYPNAATLPMLGVFIKMVAMEKGPPPAPLPKERDTLSL